MQHGGRFPKTKAVLPHLVTVRDVPHPPSSLPLQFRYSPGLRFCSASILLSEFGLVFLLVDGSVFKLLILTVISRPGTVGLVPSSRRHQGVKDRTDTSTCIIHSWWPLPAKNSRLSPEVGAPSPPRGPLHRMPRLLTGLFVTGALGGGDLPSPIPPGACLSPCFVTSLPACRPLHSFR